MSFSVLQEGTDNQALRELRDTIKESTAETAYLSKVMLTLTIISTLLALSQLKSLIDTVKWLLLISKNF